MVTYILAYGELGKHGARRVREISNLNSALAGYRMARRAEARGNRLFAHTALYADMGDGRLFPYREALDAFEVTP